MSVLKNESPHTDAVQRAKPHVPCRMPVQTMVTVKAIAWLGWLPDEPDSHVLLRSIAPPVQQILPPQRQVHLDLHVTTMLPTASHQQTLVLTYVVPTAAPSLAPNVLLCMLSAAA